ncbi:tol-pal system protein YbgF [Rhizobium sp. 'Codium 1']|uniref:tol-pal system protein YbgF n=1 Tax=Rhizobium sp. 'Codium 1' TaxID=2940484 RepID=UPI001E3C9182|nr:tol-pal system protein YbgF [Rhizobium sp. 'Codium 1']MCC8932406.1 tol-pal system protein YbgF [Rhizobium sp. 'Codium 1']
MNKLVMAALLTTATLTGLHGSASAFQLFPNVQLGQKNAPGHSPKAEVQLAQVTDPTLRVQQLEEEIRALNGRIEEMSFQLLQMQETIRKQQEDNEFRFQDLEKKSGSLTRPVTGGEQQDSVAEIITETPDVGAIADASGAGQAPGTAPGEQTLGSIALDESGLPAIATLNPDALDNGSGALPGVDTGVTATAPAAPQQTASLNSEGDVYQVAYAHVLSGDYSLAESEFRDFIAAYPSSAKIADAHFWLGEALYSQGNFNEAAKTFLNAHQTYNASPKAPEMLLKLGMSLAALENTETACATLREVSKRYPKASRAVVSKVASEQKRLSC